MGFKGQARQVARVWRDGTGRWMSGLALGAGLAALLTGCAAGAGTVTVTVTATAPGGATATATATTSSGAGAGAATATPASAPPHAFAWYQYDSSHTPQVWASVNGGTPAQITHVGPPPASGCDTEVAWSPPVFSPDLTHIAVALGSFQCGDGALYGTLSVVTVAGGAIANVPGSGASNQIRLTERAAGWLDNSTIWYVTTTGAVSLYHLGASATTTLPGISQAADAAVRGSTLFWVSEAPGSSSASYTLHRYNLGSHADLGGAITLGAVGNCQCSAGDAHTPGWDASPDGAHVAYQVVTANTSSSGGIASSHIYYTNADGSAASEIARYMVTTELVKMQISPNGKWVAFTNALPSPATLTASVSSPGGKGDSTFHGYSPDTYNYPVWKWDSSEFWAGSIDAANADPGSTTGNLYHFILGGSSGVGVAGGYNPWYTIGG